MDKRKQERCSSILKVTQRYGSQFKKGKLILDFRNRKKKTKTKSIK